MMKKARTCHMVRTKSKSLKKRRKKKATKAYILMKLQKFVFLVKLVLWEIDVYAKYVVSKANGLAHCALLMKKVRFIRCRESESRVWKMFSDMSMFIFAHSNFRVSLTLPSQTLRLLFFCLIQQPCLSYRKYVNIFY